MRGTVTFTSAKGFREMCLCSTAHLKTALHALSQLFLTDHFERVGVTTLSIHADASSGKIDDAERPAKCAVRARSGYRQLSTVLVAGAFASTHFSNSCEGVSLELTAP